MITIYLLKNESALWPFRGHASTRKLVTESTRERLIRQLRRSSVSINVIEIKNKEEVKIHSSEEVFGLLEDTLFLSDKTFNDWMECGMKQAGSLSIEPVQLAFPLAYQSILTWSSDERSQELKTLPAFWFKGQMTSAEVKIWSPQVHEIFSLAAGLPLRIFKSENTRATFIRDYAWNLKYWWDYSNICSFITREFVTETLYPLSRILPRRWLKRITVHPFFTKRLNRISPSARIHPTAILEGCTVGAEVEIGPYCYLKSSIIGAGTTIHEHTSIKASVIGERCLLMKTNVFNTVIGDGSTIVPSIIYNCVIGTDAFIGGGSGFADFSASAGPIQCDLPEGTISSGLSLLASAVGDEVFIGAGLGFQAGRSIPSGTRILNLDLIENIPQVSDRTFASRKGGLLTIPNSFMNENVKPVNS